MKSTKRTFIVVKLPRSWGSQKMGGGYGVISRRKASDYLILRGASKKVASSYAKKMTRLLGGRK